MGLTNKIGTKLQTKDVSGPVAIPGDWDTESSHITASIIRAAACSLGATRMASTTFRGSDFLSMNSSRNTIISTIWVEQTGTRLWTFSLGAALVNYGRALDWEIRIEIVDAPEGRVAKLTTPYMATHDGKLMNKDEYLLTKELILHGFSLGRVPSRDSEEEMSAIGLTSIQLPLIELLDGVEKCDRKIATTLSIEEIEQILDGLPVRVLEKENSKRSLRLGTIGQSSGQTMEVSVKDKGDHRKVRIQYDVNLDLPEAINIINVKHAHTLRFLILELLQNSDPKANFTELAEN